MTNFKVKVLSAECMVFMKVFHSYYLLTWYIDIALIKLSVYLFIVNSINFFAKSLSCQNEYFYLVLEFSFGDFP